MENREWLGAFGDRRRDKRGSWVFDRIVATGSLVIRQVGGDRAGELATHRFLDAEEVSYQAIIEALRARTVESCVGRRIVAAQDTTEVNFAGRSRAPCGLGPGGDGETPGFFIHPLLAVDADDEAVVGLLDATIWTRGKVGQRATRRRRAVADKESARWLAAAQAAARCKGATQMVVVGDRESDIYTLFAERPDGVELLVRAAQDRAVEEGGRLFEQAASWPVLAERSVQVAARGPGDRGRVAQVQLRAGRVRLKRPINGLDKSLPKHLEVTLVESREIAPPAGVEPLHWRLLTTLPATSAAEADEVVRLYRLRWRIDIDQTWRLSRLCWWGEEWRSTVPRRWCCANSFQGCNCFRVGMHQLGTPPTRWNQAAA